MMNNPIIRRDMETMQMTKRRRKVYDILCGGKNSVADITIKTGYSDPRGYIRDLRKSGVCVLDEWRTTADGARYKVYYIAI